MLDIKLDNINKKFGDKIIFENFSLEIEKGEFVCITGPSGKGKSTLLNIIGLLEHPNSGEVFIKGEKNLSFSNSKGRQILKNEIAYVFQNYGLVEDKTVEYNLYISSAFSGKNKKEDYEIALEKVGLDSTYLKQKVFELSGGEQQRVALARLYLKKSSIILADEPTGSLDANNRDKVMDILKDLNKIGKTVIIVSHDEKVTKCAKRVINL